MPIWIWLTNKWARSAALLAGALLFVGAFLAKFRRDAYNDGARDERLEAKEADDDRAAQIRDAASRASRTPGVPPTDDTRGYRD